MKVKVKDKVIVIAGKDKGKKGSILKTLKKKDQVVVEGVNMRTKHIKKTQQRAGERVKFEAPIHVSNVMLISPASNKPVRIGYEIVDGKKHRIDRKANKRIDN